MNIRPFIKECLEEIARNYVIIIYTASHKNYADSVLDYLDPTKTIYKYRLYRHNCVEARVEGDLVYIKDLRVIKNVKMSDMIIIDNSVMSFAYQLENGIPILPYYDNPNDIELKFLTNYLTKISKSQDLRAENKKIIKMDYFLKTVTEEAVENSIIDEYYTNQSIDSNLLNTNEGGLFKLNLLNNSINKRYSSEASQNQSNLSSSEIYASNSSNNESHDFVNIQNNSRLFKQKNEEDDLGYKSNFAMPKRPSQFQDTLYRTLDDYKRLSNI